MQGTQVLTGNKHLLEKHPNMYQHEISIVNEENSEPFQLMAVMNLDQVKTLHIHKGEIVGFAKHIQCLDHLVSERGFEPLPEKLESIRNMPVPHTAKEVKQFLGLIGYYRKFVPRFADISRPLTKLT